MRKAILLLLYVSIITTHYGCSTKDTPYFEDMTPLIQTMDDFNCTNSISNLSFESQSQENFLIITDSSTYNKQIKNSCPGSNINFNKHQLIIGYYISQFNIESFTYKLHLYEVDKYKLFINPNYYSDETTNSGEAQFYYFNIVIPTDINIKKGNLDLIYIY